MYGIVIIASIAQGTEQRFSSPMVAGSSPAGGAIRKAPDELV